MGLLGPAPSHRHAFTRSCCTWHHGSMRKPSGQDRCNTPLTTLLSALDAAWGGLRSMVRDHSLTKLYRAVAVAFAGAGAVQAVHDPGRVQLHQCPYFSDVLHLHFPPRPTGDGSVGLLHGGKRVQAGSDAAARCTPNKGLRTVPVSVLMQRPPGPFRLRSMLLRWQWLNPRVLAVSDGTCAVCCCCRCCCRSCCRYWLVLAESVLQQLVAMWLLTRG